MYIHTRMLQLDLVQFEMCVEFLDRNGWLVVRNTVLKLVKEVKARDTDIDRNDFKSFPFKRKPQWLTCFNGLYLLEQF